MTEPILNLEEFGARLEREGWVRNDNLAAFSRHVGPIWRFDVGPGRCRVGFLVQDLHDNSQGRVHGGMIMTLCDDGMGITAVRSRPEDLLFTVSFDCQFIGAAMRGDFVVVESEVVRATRSLMFMRGTCRIGDQVIASCSGIWKVAGKRKTEGGGPQ